MEQYPYKSMTLVLTNNCNLTCQYCFVNQTAKYMTLDIAKQAVDFMAQNLYKHKYELKDISEYLKSEIIFFGGEPLLCFDTIIMPIVKYCYDMYPNQFFFSIVTNGTLLTEEKCKFLAKNNFKVTISFDGIKKVQDVNRPCHSSEISSYDLILQNIPYIIKYLPTSIPRATINEVSVYHLYDSYLLFEKLGFVGCLFFMEYFQDLPNNKELFNVLQEQIHLIYSYRKKQYQQNIKPLYMNLTNWGLTLLLKKDLLTINNKRYIPQKLHINNYCGYGLNEINIDYYGNIYPCKGESLTTLSYSTIIGNVKEGIDFDKINQLRNQIENIENKFICNNNNCLFKKNNFPCQYMPCPAHTLQYQKIYDAHCKFFQCVLQEIISVMLDLIKENNITFLRMLDTSYLDYQLLYMQNLLQKKDIKEFIIEERTKEMAVIK